MYLKSKEILFGFDFSKPQAVMPDFGRHSENQKSWAAILNSLLW